MFISLSLFQYNGHRPVAAPRHSRNDSNEGSESGYGTLPKSDNENIDSENEVREGTGSIKCSVNVKYPKPWRTVR